MTNYLKHKMRGKSAGAIFGWIVLGVIGIVGLAILFGFVIMWLWNWLMPEIFGLITITYWQAVGLFILFKLLIGGSGSSGRSSRSYKHSNKRCDDSSKGEFAKWKHYDKFWEAEGDQAYKEYMERMNDESKEE